MSTLMLALPAEDGVHRLRGPTENNVRAVPSKGVTTLRSTAADSCAEGEFAVGTMGPCGSLEASQGMRHLGVA